MVRVERVENSRNILELQSFGMPFLCWVQHMRSQVITQDNPRLGAICSEKVLKNLSPNIPREAGMSKTPARAP